MNPRSFDFLPPATHTELLDFLRTSHSTLSPTEAIAVAVKQWIEKQRAGITPERGYQWKLLFIPETSLIRMRYDDNWFRAEVVGDEIIYRGRAVSPHQMTQEIAGDGRNAWRDLWIRLPGEKNWANAARLRAKLEKQAASLPRSPEEAMTAAAKTLSDTLNAALLLVEHVNHQSKNKVERRSPHHRREYDLLTEDH